MKKVYLIAAFILATVTLLFIPGIQPRLGLAVAIHSYSYQSNDKGFQALECPEKGATFNQVLEGFEQYKLTHQLLESQLRRTFKKNYFDFGEWAGYGSHPQWKVRYME
jgi:hypothetical protein